MQAILQKLASALTYIKSSAHQTLVLALTTGFILGCQTMLWSSERPHFIQIAAMATLALYMVKDVVTLLKEKISAPTPPKQ